MSISEFIDNVIGRPPPPYRPEHDPREHMRDPREAKSLKVHVAEDQWWRQQFNADVFEMRADLHGIRRILLVIAFILVASKAIDLFH